MSLVQIPPKIRAAMLESGSFTRDAEKLSDAYRLQAGRAVLLSAPEKRAYLAMRLPATYAAAILTLIRFQEAGGTPPRSLLDVGCGPGTASLAAAAIFGGLDSLTRSDIDGTWRDMAEDLGAASGHAALSCGRWLTGMADRLVFPQHDMAIAAYALNEIPEATRAAAVANLWAASTQSLVLIEPGTPQGFLNIQLARKTLIDLGAHIAAPCTHHGSCPMSETDWCQSAVRLPRDSAHRSAKNAALAYEDEKFSYLAVARPPLSARPLARIVKRPMLHKGHVQLDVCASVGLSRLTASRRDNELYKAARKADWGDGWPPKDQDP